MSKKKIPTSIQAEEYIIKFNEKRNDLMLQQLKINKQIETEEIKLSNARQKLDKVTTNLVNSSNVTVMIDKFNEASLDVTSTFNIILELKIKQEENIKEIEKMNEEMRSNTSLVLKAVGDRINVNDPSHNNDGCIRTSTCGGRKERSRKERSRKERSRKERSRKERVRKNNR